MEVTQSLAQPGRIRVTPGVALIPVLPEPSLELCCLRSSPCCSSQGRGLPEEGIIHFQECLKLRELLTAASLGLEPLEPGLFP